MKTSFDGHESIAVQYRRGKDMRIESVDSSGAVRTLTIYSLERHAMYRLDMQARQYTEMRGPDILASLAAWLTRAPRVWESGKTVNIYYDTIDTGERRQMFGLTARHMIIHERRVAEAGACEINSEIDRDGWYVQPQSSTGRLIYAGYIVAGACHNTVVRHGNASNPGMPLQETTTTRYSGPAGPTGISSMRREVLELSTEPLDKSLFEIPDGFQRVDDVSWTERLANDWDQLERAVSSWVE